MKAQAFIEQQAPKVFHTASECLGDQDVRLLEEEEKDRVHRDLVDYNQVPYNSLIRYVYFNYFIDCFPDLS